MNNYVKIAYLTFDDGPYALTTNYLNLLKKNNVRATFFVMYREGYEATYRRIVNEGHTLGNHTYNHASRYGLYNSVNSFITQVKKIENYLYDEMGYNTNIVRFPQGFSATGSLKLAIVKELVKMGYGYIDWTAETGDGARKKLQQKDTYSWLIDTLENQKIAVILMHDYSYDTYRNLQEIINRMKHYFFTMLSYFINQLYINSFTSI